MIGRPDQVRLSDHFLLSDFLGCHSVYAHGYKNAFVGTPAHLDEAQHLCEEALEYVLSVYGPLSVSYGYISPELSRKIVTYQDPDKPSYHRWDKGAAADVVVHEWVETSAPIYLAHELDEALPYSRLITYSESPYLCLATQLSERTPRKAFYENRYQGKKGAKPLYIKKGANRRAELPDELPHDWRGAGYPTYHGGGRLQMHHRRAGRFSMWSDFLYSTHAVQNGIVNLPSPARDRWAFEAAGAAHEELLHALGVPRISIVRGYEASRFSEEPVFSWRDAFAFDFKPPAYYDPGTAAEQAEALGVFSSVVLLDDGETVRVVGPEKET